MKQRTKKLKLKRLKISRRRAMTKIGNEISFTIQFSGIPAKSNGGRTDPVFTYDDPPTTPRLLELEREWVNMALASPSQMPELSVSQKETIKKILQPVDQETIDALRPEHPEVDLHDTMVFRDEESGKVKIFTGCYPTSMGPAG